MSNIYYTYRDFADDIHSLIRQFEAANYQPEHIVGVVRGGLPLGVHLSNYYDIPMTTILWQTRDGGNKQYDMDVVNETILRERKQVLLVDDINDSGLTFTELLDVWCHHDGETIKQYLKTACLITKSISTFTVDFEAEAMDTPDWIVFPWEREEIASHIRERRRNVAS